MRKWLMYLGLGLLLVAAAWFFWPRNGGVTPKTPGSYATTAAAKNAVASATATNALPAAKAIALSAATTNRFTFRLSNTTKSIKQLTGDRHAILLENAFIDTSEKVDLKIPTRLQAAADPGAYIVQANGLINAKFRALLASAGAQIVSYIPNNAYLVRLAASGAGALQANAQVQAVLPYQPYYKISATIPAAGASAKTASAKSAKKSQVSQPTLLQLAVEQKPLPAGTFLTLGLFADTATATIAQIEKLGGKILSQDRSPFGELVHVAPPADWVALANLPGVQLMEPAHQRKHMNDLSRQTLGVSVDSVNATNYLNLTGKNVMVEVNDTGIDQNHPDLTGRIFGDFPGSLLDTDGHGTFVAGEIAGSGLESITVTNASGSINPGTNFQYRGKAPMANLFSVGGLFNEDGETGHDTNAPISDSYFQEQPALTNALISNNSWVNEGDMAYDLSAASYDAAVRDALPEVTGPQPVLFVFAAGNDGAGYDDGVDGGNPDSIDSPGTAKDVITVGSLEQARFITNTVTTVDDSGNTNTSQPWLSETESSVDVAGYSSRGNVGIGTEGTYGRYKPDVVAPGTFVVSTRSTTWDTNVYYNPTNYSYTDLPGQSVTTNAPLDFAILPVPENAVSMTVEVVPNSLSTFPFPTNLSLYLSLSVGDSTITNNYDIFSTSNSISIPPSSGGAITSIQYLEGNLVNLAVGINGSNAVNFDVVIEYATTNNVGDYYQQLQSLNDNLGMNPQYYRYETGTSMAAAEVSGVLALMQDFFTNTLRTTPSPALLKAMLINGARPTGDYDFQVQNGINYQGWGLPNLPNSIPSSLTNLTASTSTSFYYADQSPTNALATGDSQTYKLTISPDAQSQSSPLHITLAWTDPPGNPAAAIKLVNNLNLVVSNLDNPAAPVVYYGNDIAADQTYNTPEGTNTPAVLDAINNVQNVFIQSATGTNFSITVFGTAVNVNAVTTQTNNNVTGTYSPNIVQDYALVVSSGGSSATNGFTITPQPVLSNPTDNQRITDITSTNSPLLNQFVGASSPDVATNQTSFATGSPYASDAVVSIGQTNQWHFYIVTNNATDSSGSTADVTNAAFVTFSPDTAAIPREGVFAGSDANSTRPEADVDLFVSTDPSLTNLNPVVISNCINGPQVGASIGSAFSGSALSRGGSEFVVDSNSTPGQVYYVGVQSQDQMGSEYGFVSLFSSTPFSALDTNGNESVLFLPSPANIPDGSSVLAGTTNLIGIAIYPITVQRVIATNNIFFAQNVGDLAISLSHSSVAGGNGSVTLLSHYSPNNPGAYNFIFDDSGQNDITNSQPSDDPESSLRAFTTQQGTGVWLLKASDNASGFIGTYGGSLQIQPHRDLGKQPFVTVSIAPNSWFYGYVQVPVGTTSLTVVATNVSAETPGDTLATIPLGLYVKDGSVPTLTDFDETAGLTNSPTGLPFPTGPDPGNSISIGPPIAPGIYYVGVYNPNAQSQEVLVGAYLPFSTNAIGTVTYDSTDTPIPLLDDAVTTNSIFVTNTDIIQGINVGLRVDHPRISDLAFTLISPDGSRYLLMENRGGTSTNGCGVTVYTTNIVQSVASGNNASDTNVIDVAEASGTLPISYNFYTVPDEMTVYYGTNLVPANLIYDSHSVSGSNNIIVSFPPSSPTGVSSNLTIVMNQFGNTNVGGDLWTYSAGGISTNYYYLDFTEDTNLTTTPIKFAPTPFVSLGYFSTNFTLSDFETASANDYVAPTTINDESIWSVLSNQVTVVTDPTNAFQGSNFLALANGTISNNIPTVPGNTYTLPFDYRGPGIVGWWRGEGNPNDSINGNNAISTSMTYSTGEVGQAFVFNGSSSYLRVPANSKLDVGQGNGFTLEAWVNPSALIFDGFLNLPIFEWNLGTGGGDATVGAQFSISGNSSGDLYANIEDTNGGFHDFASAGGIMTTNVFQHIALTYDKTTGVAVIYRNGVVVETQNLGIFTPQTSFDLYFGARLNGSFAPYYFTGMLDEPSVYNRVLSASEIKAIYTDGSAGKFDTNLFAASPSQSLAGASVTIAGVNNNIVGNNTSWQRQTVTFTATQTNTPIVIKGIEPGMLMDSFAVSSSDGSDLYYQPEQSLSPLIGTSALGEWQLEVLDNRAGATNDATLDSWQLQFTFANTNYTLPTPIILLTNDVPVTNTVPAGCTVAGGSFTWYQVNVPINVDKITNILLAVTGTPVQLLNVWFSTNYPPTTNTLGDGIIITNSTSGSVILATNGTLPTIIPGTTYYLGVQNLNCTNVNYAIEVGFHFSSTAVPFAFTQPATLVSGTSAQLNGMATPNGFPTYAWFEWGTNTLYGNQTTITPVGSGNNVVYITNSISNLITRLPYHYRLVVSNGVSVVRGFDQILDNANEVAWGAGYIGQTAFQRSLTNYNVTAIAGAYDHSMALLTNGTILVWGDDTYGQTNVPANVTNVVAIAGGQYYSMALLNGGTVAAWGGNVFGTPTNVPAGLSNVVAIAGGTYAETALRNDGTVTSWGINAFNLTNVPPGLSNVVAVAGGSFHNLAIKNDGTVAAWGDDSDGQTNIPAGLSNVVAVAAGEFYSLALQSNGTVVAWGDDSVGQTNVPLGLSNVVAIAAGGFHCIALKSNGNMVFWGDDSANQANAPAGLTNVVAISVGYLHSLALTTLPIASLVSPGFAVVSNGVPQTNTLIGGATYFYEVNVPTNADLATNILLFADNLPLSISWTTNVPPTIGGPNDAFLFSGTNGSVILSTNEIPPLVPGGTYYLGVDNTNAVSVTYGIEVNFHFLTNSASTNTPPVTNAVPFSSIIHTNINGTNGFLLTWFAPSNDLFQVQWTTTLVPPNWQTFTNPPSVGYNTNFFTSPTNTQFNFFDDGTQTGGFGPTRFYRLILLGSGSASSNPPPVLPVQTNLTVNPLIPFAVTNTATDAATPAPVLTYALTTTVALSTNNPVINPTNGIITWTPDLAQTGTSNIFTTIVTASGSPALSATNTFAVIVNPVPSISSVVHTNGDFLLTWFAPTNDIFQVEVATNLSSPITWLTFSNLIAYTGPVTATNGVFTFLDDGTQIPFSPLRFYKLELVGVTLPASTTTTTVPIGNIVSTNGNFVLNWTAPTNDTFNVQWATNIVPPINWATFSNTISSTNGIFSFTDTNLPFLMKFYRLWLLP